MNSGPIPKRPPPSWPKADEADTDRIQALAAIAAAPKSDDDDYVAFQVSTATAAPVALLPEIVPAPGGSSPLARFAVMFRERKMIVLGAAGPLIVAIALVIGLRSPGSGSASAPPSITSPAVKPPEAVPLPAAPPEAAADEAPAPEARPAKGPKRKSSATRLSKAERRLAARANRLAARAKKPAQHGTLLAKHSAPPSAPAERADPRATYERGNALLFAGDGAGAVEAYRKAVLLAPADPIGYRGLGLAYEQKGETTKAIRALRKYLKLAPSAPDRPIITRRIERLSKAAPR